MHWSNDNFFHDGSNTCVPKRPSQNVRKTFPIDPNSKLSIIQLSAVLTVLRECKLWSEIKDFTEKVFQNIKSNKGKCF